MKFSFLLTSLFLFLFSGAGYGQWTTNGSNMIHTSDRVGINVTSPQAALDINGAIHHQGTNILYNGGPKSDRFTMRWTNRFLDVLGQDYLIFEKIDANGSYPDGGIAFLNTGNGKGQSEKVSLLIKGNGQIGVGTTEIPTQYRFAVDGKVICEEVHVALSQSWPDYVFEDDYALMPLEQVAQHIEAHGHLPDVPNAFTVAAEGGIELGEMQRLTIQKIEELTLYLLELKAENAALKADLDQLKK